MILLAYIGCNRFLTHTYIMYAIISELPSITYRKDVYHIWTCDHIFMKETKTKNIFMIVVYIFNSVLLVSEKNFAITLPIYIGMKY